MVQNITMICGFFMDIRPPLLVLIGPMGSGKTTIGKLLAQHLGYEFFDSDKEIETATGASINWIFEKEGEAGFRERESRMLEQLTEQNGRVIATGGGAIMLPDNHQILQRGFVIYLNASVDTQFSRTCRDRSRPLLQTHDPKQRLADLYAVRAPIYQRLADLEVITGPSSPKRLVQEILDQLEQRFASAEPIHHVNSSEFAS